VSTIARTGGTSYGGVEKVAGPGAGNSALHTSLYSVANPGIREALQRFDDVALDFPCEGGWTRWAGLVDVVGLSSPRLRITEADEAASTWVDFDLAQPSRGTGVAFDIRFPRIFPKEGSSGAIGARLATASVPMASAVLPLLVRGFSGDAGPRCVSEVLTCVLPSTATLRTLAYDLVLRLPWMQAGKFHDTEISAPAEDAVSGEGGAVAAVRGLAEFFGLPVGDILAAAGISRSSFYSWDKPNQPKPRTASQGELWTLVLLAEELRETLPGRVSEWLLADEGRLRLLREGQFDELHAKVFERPFRRGEGTATAYAAAYGITDELAGPLVERADGVIPTVRARRSRVAKRAVRRPRRER